MFPMTQSSIARFKLYVKNLTEYKAKYGTVGAGVRYIFHRLTYNPMLEAMMNDVSHAYYDPNLKSNFFRWVNEGKINDCRHVFHLTSKEIGILFNKQAVLEMEKNGTTAAINWLFFCY